jgi:hypothetical protein
MNETGRPGVADSPSGEVDARIAELESRLARVEQGSVNWRERGQGLFDRVMPPEAGQHFRNAAREQLLGMRAIVDFWIARVDDLDSRAAPAPERETIAVE